MYIKASVCALGQFSQVFALLCNHWKYLITLTVKLLNWAVSLTELSFIGVWIKLAPRGVEHGVCRSYVLKRSCWGPYSRYV